MNRDGFMAEQMHAHAGVLLGRNPGREKSANSATEPEFSASRGDWRSGLRGSLRIRALIVTVLSVHRFSTHSPLDETPS